MSTTLPRGGAATLDSIERLAGSGLTAQELLEEVAERLDRVVASDAQFYSAADPETGLSMGAGIATMPEEACVPFWEHEFHVPDYNKFADLAAADVPVSDLHAATGGRPQRSPRWREFGERLGYDGELRAVFRVDGRPWGVAQLNRGVGERPFAEDEVRLVTMAGAAIARGLRDGLTLRPAVACDRGPGMAVLAGDGNVVSLTGEARAWLEDLTAQVPHGSPLRMPSEVLAMAAWARTLGRDADRGMRMRLRTRDGVWLLAHASPLSGTDGHVALVIEPAKASEVAPLIVQAYGLTPRELEVTRRIARGATTAEIAAELHLSPHTVRDYVKAIFEKVGVSSRGELVATMFADHYHDGLDAAITASAMKAAPASA